MYLSACRHSNQRVLHNHAYMLDVASSKMKECITVHVHVHVCELYDKTLDLVIHTRIMH